MYINFFKGSPPTKFACRINGITEVDKSFLKKCEQLRFALVIIRL